MKRKLECLFTLTLALVCLSSPGQEQIFTLTRVIDNPEPAIADQYGASVYLEDDFLVVGARLDDDGVPTRARLSRIGFSRSRH